jgi:endonuclease/exonuclease/phosphatase family metal-dependent hydrolase
MIGAAPSLRTLHRLITELFQKHIAKSRARQGAIGLLSAVLVTFAAQSGEEAPRAWHEFAPVNLPIGRTAQGENAVEISVLTYNVKGLPWPLRNDLEEGDTGRAMAAIGHHLGRLRAEGRAPNIVVVQEGFADETALIGMNGGYRYAVAGPRGDDAGEPANADDMALAAEASWTRAETQGPLLNSGLYAFSDFPLTVVKSRPFGRYACAGYDCLAAKGVLALAVDIPGLPVPLYALTLHLNAGARTAGVPEPRAVAAHRLQINRFAQILESLDPANPLLIGGDFNVKQDTKRQSFADERLGRGKLVAVHHRCRDELETCSPGYPARPDSHWLEPRDIQVVRAGVGVRIQPLSSEPMFADPLTGGMMSDHIGYLVRYRLSWRPPVQMAQHE